MKFSQWKEQYATKKQRLEDAEKAYREAGEDYSKFLSQTIHIGRTLEPLEVALMVNEVMKMIDEEKA